MTRQAQEPGLEYALGYSEDEALRLQTQAALLDEIFRLSLLRAGLRQGMRVLDLGSGVGDVAFMAADIVGPFGTVTGVDQAENSLEIARARAAELGLSNVRFEVARLESYDPSETFDAIIGRFVLLYLPSPAAVLKRLLPALQPGGVVVFQELDMSEASQTPPSPLFQQVNDWIFGAFRAANAEIDMGSRLLAEFRRAGFSWPSLAAMTPVDAGPESPYFAFQTALVRSLLPVIERAGLATREQIDLPTLTERLRRDAVENERVLYPPRFVSAWALKAEAHQQGEETLAG